jgi:fructose-specific phosphotransferase system IIC component
LWAGFVLALVPMLVAGGALVWWHRVLAQVPPAWLPQAFHVLLAVCGVFYVGAWVIRLLDRRAALQHPLRWLTRRLDTQSEVENALLLRLGRILRSSSAPASVAWCCRHGSGTPAPAPWRWSWPSGPPQ